MQSYAQAGRDEAALRETLMGTCEALNAHPRMISMENMLKSWKLADNIDTPLCTLHWNSNGISF
jgi:hypothetical protein